MNKASFIEIIYQFTHSPHIVPDKKCSMVWYYQSSLHLGGRYFGITYTLHGEELIKTWAPGLDWVPAGGGGADLDADDLFMRGDGGLMRLRGGRGC